MTIFFVISGIGQAAAGFARRPLRPAAGPAVRCGELGVSGFALARWPTVMRCWRSRAASGGLGQQRIPSGRFHHPQSARLVPRLGYAFSAHGLSGNLGWAAAPLFMAGIAGSGGLALGRLWRRAAGRGVLAMLIWQRDLLDVDEARRAREPARADSPSDRRFRLPAVPGVWLCFCFFFVTTLALGALQTFSPDAAAQGLRSVVGRGDLVPDGLHAGRRGRNPRRRIPGRPQRARMTA